MAVRVQLPAFSLNDILGCLAHDGVGRVVFLSHDARGARGGEKDEFAIARYGAGDMAMGRGRIHAKRCAGEGGFLRHRGRVEAKGIVFANVFSQFTGLMMVIFGTFALSSLMLIGARDALYFVLRFMLSALVYRLLFIFELAGMMVVENEGEAEREGEREVRMVHHGFVIKR